MTQQNLKSKKGSRRVSSDHSTKLGLKVPTQSTTTHQGHHHLQATISSLLDTFFDCFWQEREILPRNVGPKPTLTWYSRRRSNHAFIYSIGGFGLWILGLAATSEHKCIIVIKPRSHLITKDDNVSMALSSKNWMIFWKRQLPLLTALLKTHENHP